MIKFHYKHRILTISVLIATIQLLALAETQSTRQHVIFVPGDGGSQLEARLNKTDRVHYVCELVSDWYDIWLNLHLLVPPFVDCVYDNMRLHYNETTRKTLNTPGVEIRPFNFTSVQGVAYLDRLRIPKTDYFETIIGTLEKSNNFTRDIDLKGAPFDFRKAPNELEDFFRDLTNLIELEYIHSGFRPVNIICHSMGCLNSVIVINQKSEIWKETHIKRLISLGAPWTGSFKAIVAMLFGDNLGIPSVFVNPQKLGNLEASFPSLMYLFPREPTFKKNQVLIETPKTNYTLKNLDHFLDKIKLKDQMNMWYDVRDYGINITAPNVEIWCLYGSGYPTPKKIKLTSSIDDPISKWTYVEEDGDGDGTVNIESLEACKDFRNFQEKPVYTRQFKNLDHIDILRKPDAANFISDLISKD